ncbi:MAG TPA: DnaA/Hda family protein [Longimicrobium sp.]|jgi:SpoVK/Ycf46/Vps4 family AAA+-type ATPase|uniref:DnaA/Hda family protein n=1 Tax=Longimicrobium sp. TaxID=2029185 RepID=UPI002ED77F32
MNFSQDPRFTFETFVVGPGNRMAAAAARRAAEQPRTAYNPLFIHGPPGAGKTHLLQAVGALAMALRPELRVLYVTADGLVDRVSAAVGAGTVDALREELLDADLLLIDEAHQLAGRARTQEELVSLWDELEQQAQIVIAAEGVSPELPGVDDGLRSRFVRGLAVDLPAIEEDARPEIARRAAEQRGITLQGDAAEQIARLTGEGAAGLIAAVERVGAAQTERGGTLQGDELAGVAQPHPGSAHSMDEFSAFLSDISATVEEIVETAPWRRRLAESILRWEGEGVRTRRLEVALEADTAPDLDALLRSYEDDVARLRAIEGDLQALGADSARSPVLRDPDRVGEAEALLVSARAAAERKAEEVERARPQVDRWYFNAEKTALHWLALEDRVVEELA